MNYNPIDNAAPKNIGDHLEKIYQLTKNHAPLKAFLKEEEREILKNLISPKIATLLVITDPTEPDDPLPIDLNYLSNLYYPFFADNYVFLPEDEEFYAIIWQSINSLFFELPTGGTAKMWGVNNPNH